MNTVQKSPVEWSAIAAVILSFISLLVILGYISLPGEAFVAIERFLAALGVVLGPLLAAWFSRGKVLQPGDLEKLPSTELVSLESSIVAAPEVSNEKAATVRSIRKAQTAP